MAPESKSWNRNHSDTIEFCELNGQTKYLKSTSLKSHVATTSAESCVNAVAGRWCHVSRFPPVVIIGCNGNMATPSHFFSNKKTRAQLSLHRLCIPKLIFCFLVHKDFIHLVPFPIFIEPWISRTPSSDCLKHCKQIWTFYIQYVFLALLECAPVFIK